MRARDSGTNGWVYWSTNDPTLTPSAGETAPNYTGVLSTKLIVSSHSQPDTIIVSGSGGGVSGYMVKGLVKAYDPVVDILVFTGTVERFDL